jgi:hypothetical protein
MESTAVEFRCNAGACDERAEQARDDRELTEAKKKPRLVRPKTPGLLYAGPSSAGLVPMLAT